MPKGKKGSVIEKSEIKEEMEKSVMSTQENEMKNEETSKVEVQEYKLSAKYFDLDTFEKKTKEIPVKFTPAVNYSEAVQRLTNGSNDADKVLTIALNKELQRIVEQDARKAIASEGVPYKVVMDFIKSFRMGKPFSDYVTVEKGKSKDWKPQYDLQTEKILEEVKKHEFLMNQIRANAANFSGDDDEE